MSTNSFRPNRSERDAPASWPPTPPSPQGLRVLVACAGTSDLPVAREALLTARYLGREASLIADVGIAGVHRTLAHAE